MAMDTVIEARFRDVDTALAREHTETGTRISKIENDHRNLERDLFGNEHRAGDTGAIGELRTEVQAVKRLLMAFLLTFIAGILGGIFILLSVLHH